MHGKRNSDSPVFIVYRKIIYLQYEFACDILDQKH